MSWYAEALQFPYTGFKGPSPTPCRTVPYNFPSTTKLYSWHNAVRQVTSSWHPHQTAKQCTLSVLHHSTELVSTAPESACFTPLHLVLSDVRLACSCSAVETISMKLHTVLNCADIKASGSSKHSSSGISRALLTYMHHAP